MDPVIIHFGNAKYKRLVKDILEVWEKKRGSSFMMQQLLRAGLNNKAGGLFQELGPL